jgi:putative membrane protein
MTWYRRKEEKMRMVGFSGLAWIGMILGLVITIGVIVGLVILVVWAVRRMSGNTNQPRLQNLNGQSARDIAQVRYAKGEITREEYQNILSDLGH